MAIIDDILKYTWIRQEVPLPSQEELLSFSNNWSIIWKPDLFKPLVTPVPTVQDISNFNFSMPSPAIIPQVQQQNQNNNNQYFNPFAGQNITPFQPMQQLAPIQEQPSLLDRWLSFAWDAIWTAIPALWAWYNIYNSIFNRDDRATNDTAIDLVRQNRMDQSSFKPFAFISNLFPESDNDISRQVKEAQDTSSAIFNEDDARRRAKSSSAIAAGWVTGWEIDLFVEKERQDFKKKQATASDFLSKIKPVIWEEKYNSIASEDKVNKDKIDSITYKYSDINRTGLWATATNNAAQTAQYLSDFSDAIVPYMTQNDYALKAAIRSWDKDAEEKIRSQMSNFDNISQKVWERIKWTTDYKNKNTDATDRNAENAYQDYLKWLWYRWWENSYLLEWMVDEYWNQYNKDTANLLWYTRTWKDTLNIIKDVNSNTFMWDLQAWVWTVLAPAAKLVDNVITWIVPTVLKWAANVVTGWLLARQINDLKLRPYWEAASADMAQAYWQDYSSTKETNLDIASRYINKVWSAVPDVVANVALIMLTEWAWSVNALRWLNYVDDAANATKLLSRWDEILKWIEFVWKWITKETVQNAIIDRLDPNFNSKDNIAFNLLWSLWALWWEAWALSRELWLLNNWAIAWHVNNKLERKWITENTETYWSEAEARKAWESMPSDQKWSMLISDKEATAIRDMYNWLQQYKDKRMKELLGELDRAPQENKAFIQKQINDLREEEQKWILKQAFMTQVLAWNKLDEQDAFAFARMLQDVKNPEVLTEDLYWLIEKHAFKWSKWSDILAWVASNVAKKNTVLWDFSSFRQWDVIYRDWWIASAYVKNAIGIEPNVKYTIGDITKATISAESNKQWVSVVKEIVSKWDDWKYKYFDEVTLDNWQEWYILNSQWLSRLNADRVKAWDKFTDDIWKTAKDVDIDESTFIQKITDMSKELKLDEDEIVKIKESWVFNEVKNIVDTFIPCKP